MCLALTVACSQLELVLLRSQLAGATWTAPHPHGPVMSSLWGTRPNGRAHAVGLPLLGASTGGMAPASGGGGVPSPHCLRSAGLLPLALVPDNDALQLAKNLLYHLYGMFLAVLAASKTALDAAGQKGDHRSTVLGGARVWAPDARAAYPWHELGAGPLPVLQARPPLDAPEGVPAHWPWEARFLHALLRWAGALLCLPGQDQVRYVELALDFKEHTGRALPAAPGHKLGGVSCLFVNVRTCSGSHSTERNSFCVLVSSLGASCAHFAMHLSRLEATGAWEARVCVLPSHAGAHASP